jgi:hypothetical protein
VAVVRTPLDPTPGEPQPAPTTGPSPRGQDEGPSGSRHAATESPPPDENPPDSPAYSREEAFVPPPKAGGRAGRALRRAALTLACFAALAASWVVLRRTPLGRARGAGPLAAAAAAWAGALWVAWPRPPAAPTSFTAVTLSPWQVRLSWADPSIDASEFVIEDAPAGTGVWKAVARAPHGDVVASASMTADGFAYDFRVRAVNAAGASAPAPACTAFVPLAPMSDLSARFSNQWVELLWTAQREAAASHIERWEPGGSFMHVASLNGYTSSFVDEATRHGHYVYRMRAQNRAGVYSRWTRVAVPLHPPLAPPAAPQDVSVFTGIGSDGRAAVTVGWKGSLRAGRYAVRRQAETGEQVIVAQVGADVETFTDTTVSPGVTYSYSVSGLNRNGNGIWSDAVWVTVPGPHTRPTGAGPATSQPG